MEILYRSLLLQTHKNFEAIIVDDGSTACTSSNNREELYIMFTDSRFRIVYQRENKGPAACRNAGVRQAVYPYIFFTDTDCELHPEAFAHALKLLQDQVAVMGNTITRARSFFGRAVGLMGFPGGGLLGFEKVWPVDDLGFTQNLSTCNAAILKKDFQIVGGFNEDFRVPGGEDTLLAHRITESGYKIKYQPEQIVYHPDKQNFADFWKWHITRGRGNYQIKRRLSNVGPFLRMRLWSFKNSMVAGGILYSPFLILLWAFALAAQTIGYNSERRRVLLEEKPIKN